MKVARIADVRRIIAHGGLVRFSYKTAFAILVSADGEVRYQLDRRTYDAFLRAIAPQLSCTESGSIETNDLVVEWKQKPVVARDRNSLLE
jgi:hypothetical protein